MKKMITVLLCAALCAVILAACSTGSKSADLTAVKDAILATYPDGEMMELSSDDLLDMYGIKAEDLKQFAALIARTSTSADEILLFEAKDADAAARVKEKLDTRYQAKLNENKDYLPDEYTKVSACKVEVSGNYLSMIVSNDHEALTKLYKDAFK